MQLQNTFLPIWKQNSKNVLFKIIISISLNLTYYPEFNLEASWGGCKPILLLNYCTSRETLLACSTVANHIMFLYTILSLADDD